MSVTSGLYLILEDVRSVHNVGAIFRTADAAQVTEIFLCGLTPGPVDRFGRSVAAFHKTALGAECTMPYHVVATGPDAICHLQSQGVHVIAVEQTNTATDITQQVFSATHPVAFVFGNEVMGVSPRALAMVDEVCEIPMWGAKESLNVSVSVGITLYTYRSHCRPA